MSGGGAVVLRDLGEVIGEHEGLSRAVLEYGLLMKGLVDQAKEPGFSAESWAPLAELVAVDDFGRVGPFKDAMDWPQYVEFLTAWATAAEWECSFKRITETPGGLVFLELEERSRFGEHSSVVNTLSVYEFDAAGKLRHLDVYIQMELPGGGMPADDDGSATTD